MYLPTANDARVNNSVPNFDKKILRQKQRNINYFHKETKQQEQVLNLKKKKKCWQFIQQ